MKNKINESKNTISGTYFLGRNGIGFVKSAEFPDQIIDIEPINRKSAMHKDQVLVLLNNKKNNILSGKIIEITKRAKHGFTGTVIKDQEKFLVIPSHNKDDITVLLDEQSGSENLGKKVFVEITKWNEDGLSNNIVIGKIIETLGMPGENNAEMKAMAREQGFSESFPIEVEKEALEFEKNFTKDIEKESTKRKDLRHLDVFTIDPEDAKDFDDAISVEFLENDSFRLGIHIANVSFYVRPNSYLDKEARQRGTSVYLVDRTIPMLPEVLSNNLCSLKPNVDRLAMSAILTFNKENKIIDRFFGETIIHSKKRFTYEEAFDVIQKESGVFAKELVFLNKKTKKWRENRFKDGALNLETPEVKFVLDENSKPIDIKIKTRNDAHFLVEECMLLANREVATLMSKEKKPFIYRIHDKPNQEKMLELAMFFKKTGHQARMKEGIIPSIEITRIVNECSSEEEKSAIQTAVVRSQAKAVYSIENIGHFGLGFLFYTHFTSPIRRYPDLIVHRMISEKEDQKENSKENYSEIAKSSSLREKDAQEAEWNSIKYKQIEYLSTRPGPHQGIITGINKNGLFVAEKKSQADGFVAMRNIPNDYFIYDERKLVIRGSHNKKVYSVGDHVTIKVLKTDLEQLQIDYAIIEPKL